MFGYYLSADCPNCGDEIFYGVCATTLEYNDLPVIPVTSAEQKAFRCDNCETNIYTGEFELFDEKDL
jgi:predicted RNA-binding Zn-ribbon protein involved in translation (DUF1610 family)